MSDIKDDAFGKNIGEQATEEKDIQSTEIFKCKACGSVLKYDPATKTLLCDHCGTSEAFDFNTDEEIEEKDFLTGATEYSRNWGEKRAAFICESCGAKLTLGAMEIAGSCPFCGTAHVVPEEDFEGDIRPESLIPFTITAAQAVANFKKWIRKKLFAPSKLKKNVTADKLKGVYVPAWTYDSDTYSNYRAMGGTAYYVTEHYTVVENGKTVHRTRQVRKIRWTPVAGDYSEFMDDILVTASSINDVAAMQRAGSYDLKALVPYNPQFLAGFVAERYSIDINAGWENAKHEIANRINAGIREQVLRRYDEVSSISFKTTYKNTTYKHILVPAWISAFSYKDKVYGFMVNGQTGRTVGKTPISPLRVAVAVAVAAAVIVGLFFIFKAATGAEGTIQLEQFGF